jgi:hypothetical protein
MEGHCSIGQSPQRAVAPTEEEEELSGSVFTARYELNLKLQFTLLVILVLKTLVRYVRWLRCRFLKIYGTLRSCLFVHHEGYGGMVAFLNSFLILALNGNEWTYSCLCYCFISTRNALRASIE